jgi:predicted RNase H-like nuclease (RuvC/YqgF family)
MQKEIEKIKVPKFTRPEIEDEMTIQDIEAIVSSQEIEISNLEKEIERRKACVSHYKKYLI